MDEDLEELEEAAAAAADSLAARRASFKPGWISRTSLNEARFCTVECLRTIGEIGRAIGLKTVRTVVTTKRQWLRV